MENKFALSSLDRELLTEMKRKQRKRYRSIPSNVISPHLYRPISIYHSRFTFINDDDLEICRVMKEINDLIKEIRNEGISDDFILAICDHSYPIGYGRISAVRTYSDGTRACSQCGAKLLNEAELNALKSKLHQKEEELLSLWKNKLTSM